MSELSTEPSFWHKLTRRSTSGTLPAHVITLNESVLMIDGRPLAVKYEVDAITIGCTRLTVPAVDELMNQYAAFLKAKIGK